MVLNQKQVLFRLLMRLSLEMIIDGNPDWGMEGG